MNLSIDQIVVLTGGKLLNTTPEMQISGVATLSDACTGEASFLGNEKYFKDFLCTKASLVLVPPALPEYPEGPAFIEVENPSLAFNSLVEHFLKSAGDFQAGIHPSAIVDPSVGLDASKVRVAACAVIEAGAIIGDGCDIGAGCYIGKAAILGKDCKLYPRSVVRERCILGDRVELQLGACIGSDGFGYLLNKETGRYDTIDQVGIVVLEDDVSIGANSCIDRARFGRTVIGEGSKIDNLVQIGHNVKVGKHSIIVSQSGIAGSTSVGDYVTIAAQCGIAGHLEIGNQAVLAARTGVIGSLKEKETYWGSPCSTFKEARAQFIAIRHLPEAIKALKALQRKADEIQALIEEAQQS